MAARTAIRLNLTSTAQAAGIRTNLPRILLDLVQVINTLETFGIELAYVLSSRGT
jgi:hypothetical protein